MANEPDCRLCGKPAAYAGAVYCGSACCARWEAGERPVQPPPSASSSWCAGCGHADQIHDVDDGECGVIDDGSECPCPAFQVRIPRAELQALREQHMGQLLPPRELARQISEYAQDAVTFGLTSGEILRDAAEILSAAEEECTEQEKTSAVESSDVAPGGALGGDSPGGNLEGAAAVAPRNLPPSDVLPPAGWFRGGGDGQDTANAPAAMWSLSEHEANPKVPEMAKSCSMCGSALPTNEITWRALRFCSVDCASGAIRMAEDGRTIDEARASITLDGETHCVEPEDK